MPWIFRKFEPEDEFSYQRLDFWSRSCHPWAPVRRDVNNWENEGNDERFMLGTPPKVVPGLHLKQNVGVLRQMLSPEASHEAGDDKDVGDPRVGNAIFVKNLEHRFHRRRRRHPKARACHVV